MNDGIRNDHFTPSDQPTWLCTISTPHEHSSHDDPIRCWYAESRRVPSPVTLLGAIRDGWHWRNIVTCFVRRKHRPCGGCTPRCGRCAWCYRPLAAGGAS